MSFTESKKRLLGKTGGGVWTVFYVALLSAACVFVPMMIYDNGYFIFFGDFNVQQIPFYQLCHEMIRSGDIGWSFNTDLGANFFGSYTFYTITSPFFWLTLPFPNSFVPHLMGPLLILKFGCAAVTAFLYIRRFTRKILTAQLAALLYAFSGFSVYNIFFNHFHEAIVFFPLLLLAFELLATENKRGVFALAVAVCAIVNYFFFFGMMVFGIIYFAVRLISKAIRPDAKIIAAIFFEAVVGVLLAAVVLLPSYLAIADNSRVSEIELGWNSILFGKESIYANVFEVFFFPPDLPARPVMFPEANVKWSSLGAWMPVFSMVGVFSYCGNKKGSWLKRIIIICAVMAFVPVLNSSFSAFNNSYYVRWFYMPILMMALATAIAVEDRGISFEKGFKQVFIITAVITLIIGFFPQTTDEGLIFGLFTEPKNTMYIVRFWTTCFIALGGLAVLAFLLKNRKPDMEKFLKTAIICVAVFSVGYSGFFVASGRSHSFEHNEVVDNLIEGELKLDGDKDTFRIDTFDCMDNTAMFLGYQSINAFHSVVPASIMEFYEFVGEERDVASRPETENYAIRPLLSVKYLLRRDSGDEFLDEDGNPEMPGYNFLYNEGGFDVFENENYVGYGFSYDSFITYDKCEEYSEEERAYVMLKAMVLSEEQVKKYGYMFDGEAQEGVLDLSYDTVVDDVKKLGETSATDFKTNKSSFKATVERDKDSLVFFSVPYDEGWSAYVNGEETKIEKVNVGFMAVAVKSGESEIEFRYETPGLKTGAAISISSLLLLAVYMTATFLLRKKRNTPLSEYPEGEELLALWEIDEEEEKTQMVLLENEAEEEEKEDEQ